MSSTSTCPASNTCWGTVGYSQSPTLLNLDLSTVTPVLCRSDRADDGRKEGSAELAGRVGGDQTSILVFTHAEAAEEAFLKRR